MTTLNIASREAMKNAQILTSPPMSGLPAVFAEIRFVVLIDFAVSLMLCKSASSIHVSRFW